MLIGVLQQQARKKLAAGDPLDSDADLRLWLKLDEGTGTTIHDSAPNTSRSWEIAAGNSWVTGNVYSSALHFNAAYIALGAITSFGGDGTGPFTLATWVYPDVDGTQLGLLSNNTGTGGTRVSMVKLSTNFSRLTTRAAGSSLHADGLSITAGAWSFFAATRSGADVYVWNNNTKSSLKTGDAGNVGTVNSWDIGRAIGSTHTGRLQNLMIFDRALSDADILALYARGT